MSKVIEPELFNQQDACSFMNIHRTTFARVRLKPGFPKPVTMAHAEMWLKSELLEWIKSQRSSESSEPSAT